MRRSALLQSKRHGYRCCTRLHILVAANIIYAIFAMVVPIISFTNVVSVQASTLALPYLVVAFASLVVAGAIAVYGASMYTQATQLVRSVRDRNALDRLLILLSAFVLLVVALFLVRLVLISFAFARTIHDDYTAEPKSKTHEPINLVNPDLLLMSHCPAMSAGACTWVAIWLPELVPATFMLALLWRPEGDRALAVLGPELQRLAEEGEGGALGSLQVGAGKGNRGKDGSGSSFGTFGGPVSKRAGRGGGGGTPGGLERTRRGSSAASLARSRVSRLGLQTLVDATVQARRGRGRGKGRGREHRLVSQGASDSQLQLRRPGTAATAASAEGAILLGLDRAASIGPEAMGLSSS